MRQVHFQSSIIVWLKVTSFENVLIVQRCTTFLGDGLQCIISSALEARRQNYDLNFRKWNIKNRNQNLFTQLVVWCFVSM